MIIVPLTFLQRMIIKPKIKKFLEKIGLYAYIKKIYWAFLIFIGKNGLRLKLNDVSAKIIVSTPYELNYYHSLGGEEKLLKQLLSKINTKTVFYDAGAYIGMHSISVAKYKIAPKSIYCWEPDPFNFKKLQENINLNNADIIAFPVALGSKNAIMKMATGVRGLGSSQSSLTRKGLKSVSVQVVKGDDWVSKKNLYLPSIIKIDVEGYEFNVLKGFEQTIRKAKPSIFLEIHPVYLKCMGVKKQQVLNFLCSLGYKPISLSFREKEEHYVFEPLDKT